MLQSLPFVGSVSFISRDTTAISVTISRLAEQDDLDAMEKLIDHRVTELIKDAQEFQE